jgi:hypothetical protein
MTHRQHHGFTGLTDDTDNAGRAPDESVQSSNPWQSVIQTPLGGRFADMVALKGSKENGHLLERKHNDRFAALRDQAMPQWRLHRPVVKMKVTTQGGDVINLLWAVIAARGLKRIRTSSPAARPRRWITASS